MPKADAAAVEDLIHILGLCRDHGSEGEELLGLHVRHAIDEAGFLPVSDTMGNVWVEVGTNSRTMFTSHLDTVHSSHEFTQELMYYRDGKDVMVMTADGSCLGADDGTGVWLMLNMIREKVPGLYCFFVGEEVGRVGSGHWRNTRANDLTKRFDRCISFDRKGYDDVVATQMNRVCVSKEFHKALLEALKFRKTKCDHRGSFTDSFEFIDDIPECTNISVGYFSQHGPNEIQNLSFANRLRKRLCNVKWELLPTARTPGPQRIQAAPKRSPGTQMTHTTPPPTTKRHSSTDPLTYQMALTLAKTEPELLAAYAIDTRASLLDIEDAHERQQRHTVLEAEKNRRMVLFSTS